MSALRQTAAQVARRARTVRPGPLRTKRSYASEHGHDHHHEHNVEESFGVAFYGALAVIASSVAIYKISRPGPNGELSTLHKYWQKVSDFGNQWETRAQVMAAALEQASHDKHLLLHADRSKHHELTYPEVFTHGSPHNIPAGHYPRLDKVIAHYQKLHVEEEARKAKKLAAEASKQSQQ
ncbi:hypothetical protein VTJ83DRAFT_1953 [Remersonia thermophila]|uniref:NADH-ubiquinone oxidoreductase 17.8 kDa subunit n=1 Tax=Remersonia thermophila TaxID=72144 RepID=A0ABR4DHJ4_9PEZI